MIQFPAPPNTLATRQITCICCHEQFTVSVDVPDRRQRFIVDSWHVPADRAHSTELRYEANRRRRQTSPVARAVPEPNPEHSPHRDREQYYFVTCPRCGADNRNWLNFLGQMPFPWQNSFLIGCALTLLAGVGIVILRVDLTILPDLELNRWTRWLPLLIAVVLVGLLPLWLIPGLWYETRLRKYMTDVVPAMKDSLSPAALRTVLIWGILALLLPFVIYVIPPLLRQLVNVDFGPRPTLVEQIDTVSGQIDQLPESAPVTNAFVGLTAVLNTQLRACEKTQIDQMIADLQAIASTSPHGNLLLVTRTSDVLSVIRETADDACRNQLIQKVRSTLQPVVNETNPYPLSNNLTLQQCRDQWQAANDGQNVVVDPACYNFLLLTLLGDLGRIENSQAPIWNRAGILAEVRQLVADPNLLPGPRAQIASHIATLENSLQASAEPSEPWLNWRYLVFWFTAVSLTALLSSICAFQTLNQRIDWLDPHVPRPIFTSVANMTRVAVWEAKHALEIDGYEHRIQWTRAIRNEVGGIDLVGFFRDPPELLSDGTMSNLVRAQRYGVSTDMWCHIREARISDMMAQRPAGGPAFALPEFAPTTAVVTVGRQQRY